MNKNIKLIINYFLGPLLFIFLSWSLYKQITHQPDLPERWNQIKHSWQQGMFWIVFFLMFINWGIESRKWQLQVAPLEKLNFLTAVKSVLSGCSITMLTPNRIGEYGGRIMYIKEENRLKAISLTILGSISQLAVTLIIGTVGLLYLKYVAHAGEVNADQAWFLHNLILYVSIAVTVILLIIYFRLHLFIQLVSRISFLKSFVKHIEVVDVFSGKQLLRILFLSFFRYMVFILQYMLLLRVMQVNIPMVLCFCLLALFYLVMAIAPTIGFTELPVRATASAAILGLYSDNLLGMQAATFGIWLINLVVPAIMGSVFILGIKIMKER